MIWPYIRSLTAVIVACNLRGSHPGSSRISTALNYVQLTVPEDAFGPLRTWWIGIKAVSQSVQPAQPRFGVPFGGLPRLTDR